jgi:hypothetical protein
LITYGGEEGTDAAQTVRVPWQSVRCSIGSPALHHRTDARNYHDGDK